MKIKDFGIEIWMNTYENKCKLNIAETCVDSLTVGELLELAGATDTVMSELSAIKLTYGAIEGTERLRKLIAGLYEKQTMNNIIVTHGAIGANALVHETLVEPGDRVISVMPTYQQHYSIPASYGADVQILRLKEENGYLPDLEELKQLATVGTKLIAINNPNNPTGSLMDEEFLKKIVEIARGCGAWLLSDEVYRGMNQEGDGATASIADLYEKGISTASMSKTFALAGLRLGWIAGPVELIHAVSIHRDYNTISVGMLDDYFAAMALENKDKVLARSQKITRDNLALLSDWVDKEELISWVKPKSGTTALLKYDLPLTSVEFCTKLLDQTGVMLVPGSAMDMEGTLRVGFSNNGEVLKQGLELMSKFLATEAAKK